MGTVQMEEARDGVVIKKDVGNAIKDAVSAMGLSAKHFSTESLRLQDLAQRRLLMEWAYAI